MMFYAVEFCLFSSLPFLQIVVVLQPEPKLRGVAKILRQAQRRIGRYSSGTSYYFGKFLSEDTGILCKPVSRYSQFS